ncbi:MAG: restriction endonuclease subunit S, partial [Christensenellales bacterium]
RITPCLENGKTGFVQCLNKGEIGIGSTEFIVLQNKKLTPEVVYIMARQEEFRELLIKSMTGASGRQRADAKILEKHTISVPPQHILDTFSKIAQPCFSQIKCLNEKNINLRKTRDLLLPWLISGDIEVSNIPIPMEEGRKCQIKN